MGSHHRKLIADSVYANTTELCFPYCVPQNKLRLCPLPCLSFCSSFCSRPWIDLPPPSPPFSPVKPNKFPSFLIVAITLVSVTFLVACGYVFYSKCYSGSRRRSDPLQSEDTTTTRDEFLDEGHGPVLDHPIWYIHTVGLQPSIINAITVFRYKKGDGLVDGTDCSVCLSEFQEDETLRLLPKCSHAFHIPCIDTWLRSHTNCPMCRAPIVISRTPPFPEAAATSVADSIPVEETQVGVLGSNGGFGGEMEGDHQVCDQLRIGAEMEYEVVQIGNGEERGENSGAEIDGNGILQEIRKSFSFDSSSGSKINLSDPCKIGTNGNGGNKKSARVRGTSSIEKSLQSGPVSMTRSVSCNGKLVLCRQTQSRDSVIPLRSI
ncbi:hypothetical protein FNV43_RR22148 [Rhamnella rubrinervis]|uniref:RING-type E3 ubiquitin transferase n=1 Tax=Rhamnella rubrinervis TaxID=2594499 RepID=A0A8K0DUL9_9ROSA|nr:hypothetical protein FNV43_RR22148 [Rhamnella rubrinervis]